MTTQNDSDDSESEEKSTLKKCVSTVTNDIDDTARIATGFILGGITAAHFDFGPFIIILLGGIMIGLEVVYMMTSVYYEAWQIRKEKVRNNE